MADGERAAYSLWALAGEGGGHEIVIPWIRAERAVRTASHRIGDRRRVAARAVEQNVGEHRAPLKLPREERTEMAVVQCHRIGWLQ